MVRQVARKEMEEWQMFNTEELQMLRNHQIEIFSNRVIFNAQPPMSEEEIDVVHSFCKGAVPATLLSLWRQTAGGNLEYDLVVRMNGRMESISFTELFFNDSDGYHDLRGWIDNECELLSSYEDDEIEEDDDDLLLEYLPFGGFEYLDRVYIAVKPGSEYGNIIAWKKGLPEAWEGALHEDSVATVSKDLPSAFKKLCLQGDPLNPNTDGYFTGQRLLEYVSDQVDNGLPSYLADKLVAFYRRAVVKQVRN